MMRIAAIIGSASPVTVSGALVLPMSDRGAVALAMARFAGDVRAYAADAEARCFARAAGIERVEGISELEMASVDVVLIGRGGCADRGDMLPVRLAEAGGAALLFDVIDVQRESDRLLVMRDLGRGARDLLAVCGRAVLVVSESVERGPYVSRYRMNAANAFGAGASIRDDPGGQPTSRGRVSTGGESNDVGWEPAAPRVRLGDHAARVAGSAMERMNALFGVGDTTENSASLVRGTAEECARHLLRYLAHHEFVGRGSGGEWESVAVETDRPQPAPQRDTAGVESIPIRVRRRPRALPRRPHAVRGPFEIGVDI